MRHRLRIHQQVGEMLSVLQVGEITSEADDHSNGSVLLLSALDLLFEEREQFT